MEIKTFKKGEKFYHATMQIDNIGGKDYTEILQTLSDSSKGNENSDWGNSLYTSQYKDVALGYICQDGEKGCIIELEAKEPIPCFYSDEIIYASSSCGQYTPESTKEEISKFVQEKVDGPFMTFLGNKGYVFECFHDDSKRTEVIIPSCMVEKFVVVKVNYLRYNTREFRYEEIMRVFRSD